MGDETIEVENKLKMQVDHIFRCHDAQYLKDKIYDLAFEWYMKGLRSGVGFEQKQKKVEVKLGCG